MNHKDAYKLVFNWICADQRPIGAGFVWSRYPFRFVSEETTHSRHCPVLRDSRLLPCEPCIQYNHFVHCCHCIRLNHFKDLRGHASPCEVWPMALRFAKPNRGSQKSARADRPQKRHLCTKTWRNLIPLGVGEFLFSLEGERYVVVIPDTKFPRSTMKVDR